ncbi:MAG: hypothetical protein M3347_11555 [Armatimonadota bacterium]|nr:hypothetical protein [Armatimonadota bacterium]
MFKLDQTHFVQKIAHTVDAEGATRAVEGFKTDLDGAIQNKINDLARLARCKDGGPRRKSLAVKRMIQRGQLVGSQAVE